MQRLLPLFTLLCGLAALPAGSAAEGPMVKAGAGSYLTQAPKTCKPLPAIAYRTREVQGPMLTNQWWSSLVWQKHSQNMFPHPAVVRADPDGLMMAYPGSRIHGNQAGIFGSADLQAGDLKIGHSAQSEFPQADCAGYSDWFVTASFTRDAASLQTSFGHGSPFVYGMVRGGEPKITFSAEPKVWSGNDGSAVVGVTVNGHHYALFGPSGSTWSGLETRTVRNQGGGKGYFSVAVLPDARPETLQLFARYAHSHVTGSKVEYQVRNGKVRATYRFQCTPREGSEKATLFALYPHQWKYTATSLTPHTYGSVRGVLKVGAGDHFTTEVPVQGLLPHLPSEGIADRARMTALLRAEAAKSKPGYGDTYWEGKHLGTLASLSGIAEAAGERELRGEFIAELKRRLEDWLTAAPGEEQPVFYYDRTWGSLIGSRPSYGSDMPLNDHHFHYGYFIRAAAEIARVDPAWAKEWGPMVRLLIRDIASPDRRDPMFPFLRCFDLYAGHSWASGDANFGDGNNQESSSESLNAWYGMMLWGEATGDAEIRDTGIFLFNTERTAVEEYWFDVSGTNYPADFPHVALGMIWGGKGAFGTWFSADIDCIHGINWLPFTPASLYMGRHPAYVKKNHERIVAGRKGGRDYNNGWGDLVLMFSALHDPAAAAAYLLAQPENKIESGNSRPFMEHWVHTLHKVGLPHAGATSTHPFAAVFHQAGTKTYAAYNFGKAPLTVTFADGKSLTAAPGGLTLSR